MGPWVAVNVADIYLYPKPVPKDKAVPAKPELQLSERDLNIPE